MTSLPELQLRKAVPTGRIRNGLLPGDDLLALRNALFNSR